ncbi:MAG: restriction endonuclease subunit S [Actinobacteria bacterium]|nr:restriction endonuclease subunit S [Actinomycetota bacterium]
MGEWRTIRLEELAADEKSAISKPYGSAILREDYLTHGVPVVRGMNLTRGLFHDDDFVFISPELAGKMPGAILEPGDLVVTHRGTLGQVSMISRSPRYERYVASTSHVKVRLDSSRAIPEYYYYWFRSEDGQHSLLVHASSVGVPGIAQPVATLKALRVPLPPVEVQRAVSEVLGALDYKIVANENASRLVDELLKTQFSKLSANAPTEHLGCIAEVNLLTTRPRLGTLHYLDISSVSVGHYVLPDRIDWTRAPGRARRVVSNGDTIWSTVRPNRRSHALILDEAEGIIASTGLAVVSPKPGRIAGVYECTKRDEFVQYLESVAEGSAYPAVRGERFLDAPIPRLTTREWDEFEAIALPLRRRVAAGVRESRALAVMRDELLPLLMSGRIRVRDAEKVVEEVL